MDYPSEKWFHLNENFRKNPVLLAELLGEIFEVLKAQPHLHRDVPYNLTKKGQNDQNRLARIWEYNGPDKETVNLLSSHSAEWLQWPLRFWQRPMPPQLANLDPQSQIVGFYLHTKSNDVWSCMVRRCSCILLVEFRERYQQGSYDAVASALSQTGLFDSVRDIASTVNTMIDEGYRFRNIEKAVSEGATLVLGTGLPKTTWSKIIPKKGKDFDEFMEHLRSIGIPEWADKYRDLYRSVLNHQLGVLASYLSRQ